METQERTGTPEIVIHSAMYGIGNDRSIDVTEVVARLVADGCGSVVASNDNFKDPAIGMVKQLTVKYSVDGVAHDKTVGENDTITFAEPEPADDPVDLNNVSYSELQSMLKEAGLPANGSKEELIERLTKPVEPADSQE